MSSLNVISTRNGVPVRILWPLTISISTYICDTWALHPPFYIKHGRLSIAAATRLLGHAT